MATEPTLSRDTIVSTSRVLEAVRVGGCVSRGGVTGATGLAKALVAERLRSLIDRRLVREGGALSSQGGRPAQRLSFASGRGYVLAIEIGMTHLSVSIADLSGQPRGRRSVPIDMGSGPSEVCGAAMEVARELQEFQGSNNHGMLLGAGIGVAAPVEFATGRTINPPVTPNWHNFPIRERFSSLLRVPTWVDNEVNLMALAESRVGAAKGHDNTLTFKLGSWIGAGLVSNGLLHRGAQGCAGSLASTAGGEALERAARALADSGKSIGLANAQAEFGRLTVPTISKVAEAGDAAAARLLDEAVVDIGRFMSIVIDFFNPSLVVIGGGMSHGGEGIISRIRETIYGSAISLATRDLHIVPSVLDDEAGVTGAAIMTLDGLFSPQCLADTLDRLDDEPAAAPFPPLTDVP